MTSDLVFMTNGPAQASGSLIGRPPTTITSIAGERLSWLRSAARVRKSPAPSTADWPIRIGRASVPTVPAPLRT